MTNSITYHIPDKEALAAACMPFIIRGGLFLKGNSHYPLGTQLTITLQLLDEPDCIDFLAKVVWLTPRYESDQLPEGCGVQFCEEDSKPMRFRIEAILPEAFTLKATSIDFFG